jgi:hypothetical protein
MAEKEMEEADKAAGPKKHKWKQIICWVQGHVLPKVFLRLV